MFEVLHIHFADTFIRWNEAGKSGYDLIKMSVPLTLMNDLYFKFMKDGGIEPIENLPKEKKQFYFDQSCKYYEFTEQRIKASKAAYVLDLITSNN